MVTEIISIAIFLFVVGLILWPIVKLFHKIKMRRIEKKVPEELKKEVIENVGEGREGDRRIEPDESAVGESVAERKSEGNYNLSVSNAFTDARAKRNLKKDWPSFG